jgi:hypothetical protein
MLAALLHTCGALLLEMKEGPRLREGPLIISRQFPVAVCDWPNIYLVKKSVPVRTWPTRTHSQSAGFSTRWMERVQRAATRGSTQAAGTGIHLSRCGTAITTAVKWLPHYGAVYLHSDAQSLLSLVCKPGFDSFTTKLRLPSPSSDQDSYNPVTPLSASRIPMMPRC